MGVLNVTPDSFSDGGQFVDPEVALKHARQMIEEGADIIDIGAESTRPYGGAKPVTLEEELARLQPVLPAVVQMGVPVSIDTLKPEVAYWALGLGVRIVNDVWGLQRDPNMARVVGQHGVPVVIMHNRYKAEPTINIVSDINAFFDYSLDIADKAGIPRDAIVLDPGHRLRQDPGAEHGGDRQARKVQALRPADPGRRLAQALHQFGVAVGADEPDRRLDCRPCDGLYERRHDHPDPRRGRDHPGAARRRRPPGHSNDRSGVRQWAGAARLSRRDAARGQGRPDLQARSRARSSI